MSEIAIDATASLNREAKRTNVIRKQLSSHALDDKLTRKNRCMATNNYSNQLYDSSETIDSDEKFRRFIYGNLFATGLHVWWLIGLFGLMTIASVAFAFFAATVDADLLRDRTAACAISDQSNNFIDRHNAYDRLLSETNLQKLSLLELSRRELSRA